MDAAYLKDQYSDPEKLRIRAHTHREFTEGADSYLPEVFRHLQLAPGLRLLDVGCGDGGFHARFASDGAVVVGLDQSVGMLRSARGGGARGLVQGDAVALPLASASFDRVTALHMLFHVPDRGAALREIRRVVRPGGRVVLSTNGPTNFGPLLDLHAAAARQLGYEPAVEGVDTWFSLADLPLVQSVFPTAERFELHSALVFPAAEPAVRFYATGRVDRIRNAPADHSHRPRLLALVRSMLEARIAADGEFRMPKTVGFFVADV